VAFLEPNPKVLRNLHIILIWGKGFRVQDLVQFGTVLDLRTNTSQKREAVPRRARIQGSEIFVSLHSGVIKNKRKIEGL